MENLLNGRGEKLVLTPQEAKSAMGRLDTIFGPDERDKIGKDLSVKLNFPGLIDVLHELFGGYKEMAVITGVSAKTVKRWASGIRKPQSLAAVEQFRLALRLCTIIYDGQNPHIKAWFNTANPSLNDKAPLELLTKRDLRGVSKFPGQLLSAAKDFQRVLV